MSMLPRHGKTWFKRGAVRNCPGNLNSSVSLVSIILIGQWPDLCKLRPLCGLHLLAVGIHQHIVQELLLFDECAS